MSIPIVTAKCISCGACVVLCPHKAITLRKGGAYIDPARCSRCRKCVYQCYMRAIQIQ